MIVPAHVRRKVVTLSASRSNVFTWEKNSLAMTRAKSETESKFGSHKDLMVHKMLI